MSKKYRKWKKLSKITIRLLILLFRDWMTLRSVLRSSLMPTKVRKRTKIKRLEMLMVVVYLENWRILFLGKLHQRHAVLEVINMKKIAKFYSRKNCPNSRRTTIRFYKLCKSMSNKIMIEVLFG